MLVRKYLLILCLVFGLGAMAQENPAISNDSLLRSIQSLKKDMEVFRHLKISGWIQMQYQHADSAGLADLEGGKMPANVDSRFMIRRGRVKFVWQDKLVTYVAQINLTERFVNIADLYVKITDPWTKWLSFQAGMMNRPFTYDISYSSADREIPERARYIQLLTPNERDAGAQLIVEAPKTSKWSGFKVEAGIFNGTGLMMPNTNLSDIDSRKDFIGRISYYRPLCNEKMRMGIGFSHYNGYERMANNLLYKGIGTNENGQKVFNLADSTHSAIRGAYARRLYYNFEGLFSVQSSAGTTTLRGEYCFGQQPGSLLDSRSAQSATVGNTYLRQFAGYYVCFIQRIMQTKHEFALRYESYDPNTLVKGNQIGNTLVTQLGVADLRYTSLGLGYNCYLNPHFKLMIYYNILKNETSNNLAFYSRDLKDNVLTIRVQCRF